VLAHSVPHEINTNFLVLQNQGETEREEKERIRNAEQKADLGNVELFPIFLL
jgi:hypothetical protein